LHGGRQPQDPVCRIDREDLAVFRRKKG